MRPSVRTMLAALGDMPAVLVGYRNDVLAWTPMGANLYPSAFDELMPKTLATATVDRLMRHAHVCQTSGDSIRLTRPSPGRESSP